MERNFDKIQIGHWYLSKDGLPEQILDYAKGGDFPFLSKWQSYKEDGSVEHCPCDADLVTEIEPPVFVHVKRKKKVKKHKGLYESPLGLFISQDFFSSLEEFDAACTRDAPYRRAISLLDLPETTIECEVEE